jgi:hypothetical protein
MPCRGLSRGWRFRWGASCGWLRGKAGRSPTPPAAEAGIGRPGAAGPGAPPLRPRPGNLRFPGTPPSERARCARAVVWAWWRALAPLALAALVPLVLAALAPLALASLAPLALASLARRALDCVERKRKAGRCRPAFSTLGAPGAIRTPDPQIRSLMLYPAELRAHRVGVLCRKRVHSSSQKSGDHSAWPQASGTRSGWIRSAPTDTAMAAPPAATVTRPAVPSSSAVPWPSS